ncbi:MAG: SurA N-terminal domain-containing protein [Alistipes sp.]
MASLNTLRTKFGVVLSIIIGLALLAFVLSLKTEMGFSGNDPKVGVIGGDKIKYSEYLEEYDRAKQQNGGSEGDAQQADAMSNAAWQMLLTNHVMKPGFEKLGVTVGETERLGLISGDHHSEALYRAFADPRTGTYDVAAVAEFLARAETDVQAQVAWSNLNEQVLLEREFTKYLALLKGGVYVNNLEVTQGVATANNSYTGHWAGRKYDTVADSLLDVSESEIRAYYDKHKRAFRQIPSRTISYVVFDVNATEEDMQAIQNTATTVGEEFAAAADVKAFVRGNRNGQIDDRYISAAQLPAEEAQALLAGTQYGPVLKDNAWTMARVVDTKMVSDTLGIRHIVLPYAEEKRADSLLIALRGGADFAQAAHQFSVYGETAANGGEVGVMPFSAFTGEFATALAGAKQGDIVKIVSGDAIQLMQVYRADAPTKHMIVATITYPIEASEKTRSTIHNAAGTFSVSAKGSVEKFNEAASTAVVTPRVSSLGQGERELQGLEDSRDLVRWAYGAKVGDLSEIFAVGGNYVIATITDIDDEKYMPIKRATDRIKMKLLRDKKYDYIVKNAKGSSFSEMTASLDMSEGGQFDSLKYAAYYIQGLGVEPRVVAAIATTKKSGEVSAPVKGGLGVYLFQVDNIATEQTQTPEAEKVRAQAMAESMMQQYSLQAIQQMAEVEDLRGKYF